MVRVRGRNSIWVRYRVRVRVRDKVRVDLDTGLEFRLLTVLQKGLALG